MRQLKINQKITKRDENSVSMYLQEVSRYPMISPEEEVELAVKIRNGDENAMQKLVEANLRFVISVAKQFQNQGLSLSDLINEGNLGLIKAANKFDETRGFKFISYAVWWIRQSIIQAISEQARIIRLPLNRLTIINKISKATLHLEQEYAREPTNSELAEFLEIQEDQIKINENIKRSHISFDKPLVNNNESNFTLMDLIHADDSHSPDVNLLAESTHTDLIRALEKLSQREARILFLSFGLNNSDSYTLNDIAKEFNMTSERVRQIRCSALIKMKFLMTNKTLFNNNL
ncbi:MAG: RNA polymerase subunit sigma [Marinilabiliales bacterium]|nr:MAG: RNA polymerase subunit sigma [Marinilabiliales bacterium]